MGGLGAWSYLEWRVALRIISVIATFSTTHYVDRRRTLQRNSVLLDTRDGLVGNNCLSVSEDRRYANFLPSDGHLVHAPYQPKKCEPATLSRQIITLAAA